VGGMIVTFVISIKTKNPDRKVNIENNKILNDSKSEM
jgi:hypothetical protein